MRNYYFLFLLMLLCHSCANDDKAIDQVFDNITTGAILRTTQIDNLTMDMSNLQRPVSFALELQDGNSGDLLESVDLFISFIDRTSEQGNNATNPILYRTLSKEDFTTGDNGLPVTTITIETQEFLQLFSFTPEAVRCTDIFKIDLNLNLKDGRIFNHNNSIGPIISFAGAINSPFTYDVVVVEGVTDDFMTGTYTYESIQDGFDGPTFISPELISINTSRPNTRNFEIFRDTQQTVVAGIFVRAEIEFTIACDQAILTRYVRSAIILGCGVEGDQHVLLGPASDLSGSVNIKDGSVFDLRFIEAFEGNDGLCGWPTTPSEIRFSKQ